MNTKALIAQLEQTDKLGVDLYVHKTRVILDLKERLKLFFLF